MKYLIVLVVLTGFFGCAKEKTQFTVDNELMPYYQSFIHEGKIRGKNAETDNLILQFGDATSRGKKVLAYCGRELSSTKIWLDNVDQNTPKIIIDEARFNSLTEIEKRTVVFHEMGHCLLNRNHTQELNEYQYAKSIMYPYLITEMLGIFYNNVESYYIDELFDPNAPTVNPSGSLSNHSKKTLKEFTLSSDGCDHSDIKIEETNLIKITKSQYNTIN